MVERPFLTADWRHLVMLNYQIDSGVLLPLVPSGTELDLRDGHALVSVVGFRFLETRILGLAVPFHVNFDEVNLRFYVRRRAAGEWRHGVVFVKEVVARRAIAVIARLTYNEPYVTLPTRNLVDLGGAQQGDPGLARYQWREERWYTVEATTTGLPRLIEPGSEAEFITHRGWGYTGQRDGSTVEYRVSHPRWRVWDVATCRLDCDVARMYGRPFAEALGSAPFSALVAEGSPVRVFRGSRVGKEDRLLYNSE